MKKIIILIITVALAIVGLSGCIDNIPPITESKLKYSDGEENDAVSMAKTQFFNINTMDIMTKLDKIVIRLNCDSIVTCNIRDTTQWEGNNEGSYYKIIATMSMNAPNNQNADFITFDFSPDVTLKENTVYHIEFISTNLVAIRTGNNAFCYQIWGW